MYALSKTPVSQLTAQTLITAHFGSKAHIQNYSELTDGMYNAAYLVELMDTRRFVLKVAPPDDFKVMRYEKNIMAAEVEVLRLLHARTEIPVPDVFAYDTSRRWLTNDYFIMSFVPGTAFNKLRDHLSAEERRPIDIRTGEYLRQIHAITHSSFGYFAQPNTHTATWRAAFISMLEGILADGKDANIPLPIPYDEFLPQLERHLHVLDAVTQPRLVHWDLWDGNIFVDPQTKQITGILDCERALWGDPLMEANFGAFGSNPAVLTGYGVDLLASPSARTCRSLYNLYLWLIMTIECTYRQFETKDQENWARNKLDEELKILEGINYE